MNNEDFHDGGHVYKLTQKNKVIEGEKEVTVYGVTVVKSGYTQSEDKRFCVNIEDVSSDKQTVENFISMLSRNNTSPLHVRDCLEDFFSL